MTVRRPGCFGEDGDETVTYTTRARNTEYVRAEVRKPGGVMAALTNPIFVGRK